VRRKIIFAISGKVFQRILPPPDALLPQFAQPRGTQCPAIGRLQPDNYHALSLEWDAILESPCPTLDAPPDLLDETFGN
jgi:hypothetical protein